MIELSKEILDFTEKSTTQNFLKAARTFTALLENKNIEPDNFYRQTHLSLIELYVAGHRFETIDLKYSNEKTEFKEIDKEKLKKQNLNQISTLENDCFYWEVYDPYYDKDVEPTQGWLVDDFIDIYWDLKNELYKIDEIGTDEAIEDAFWGIRFGFNHHWGHHCISAMRALHFLHYDGKPA